MAIETVNVDEIFMELLGELPFTLNWADAQLKEKGFGTHGILKRMLAAFRSAGSRGHGDSQWNVTWDGRPSSYKNGAIGEIHRTGVFTCWSRAGRWSGRPWRLEAPIRISIDDDSVEWFGAEGGASGTLIVGSKEKEEETAFKGVSVALLAIEVFRRCVMHRYIDEQIYSADRTPDWHKHALRGVAQIIYAHPNDDLGRLFLHQLLCDQRVDQALAAPGVLEALVYALSDGGSEAVSEAVNTAWSKWKRSSDQDLSSLIEAESNTTGVDPWYWDEDTLGMEVQVLCSAPTVKVRTVCSPVILSWEWVSATWRSRFTDPI